MQPREQRALLRTRRHFLQTSQAGLGALGLAQLLPSQHAVATETAPRDPNNPLAPRQPPLPAKAKRVIYIELAGAPPQQEMFDYKPTLVRLNMQPCPDEMLKNQRFAFIKGHPKLLGTPYKFSQHGSGGTWVSELLPNIATIADEMTVIRSMNTDQFNHAPADLFMFTGNPRFGNASMGSWITYGLGSESADLPGFVVLISGGSDPTGGKSCWGSGYLPSVYQGVQCRSAGEPILYVNDPKGMSRDSRRRSLDALQKLNQLEQQQFGDPETATRISQYELAFRMQTAVPEVMDIAREPKHVLEAYGATPGQGAFANNCLLARRLVEQGVRYVQLFDWGWDIHGTGPGDDIMNALPRKTKDVDQPIAALVKDLKHRGMLDETLIICGGEFGRTSMNEARGGSTFLGRDHHPHCFTLWMAGGGVKGGFNFGQTDEFGYQVAENKVGVHDIQHTILHLLGIDAKRFSFPFQGLENRLIGPADDSRVLSEILA
jgi:hypothetical protein